MEKDWLNKMISSIRCGVVISFIFFPRTKKEKKNRVLRVTCLPFWLSLKEWQHNNYIQDNCRKPYAHFFTFHVILSNVVDHFSFCCLNLPIECGGVAVFSRPLSWLNYKTTSSILCKLSPSGQITRKIYILLINGKINPSMVGLVNFTSNIFK